MKPPLGPLLGLLLLSACAAPPSAPLSSNSVQTSEAKEAWLRCARDTARTYPETETALDRATVAVGACSHLRPAIVAALRAENEGKPNAVLYVGTYMAALDKRAVALTADALMRGQ